VPTAFSFTTGSPDLLMGSASRPEGPAGPEVESADDFILTTETSIDHATFTGLLPNAAPLSTITKVDVEFYRVFPADSNTARTPQVPTRQNSPADLALEARDSTADQLTFAATLEDSVVTVQNSVVTGIHPAPNQTTGGEGSKLGEEIQLDVSFAPVVLSADHYFFVPQVQLSSGDFLWLSAPRPTSPPFANDLQSWIRNAALNPDWLRIGTDIVGGTTPPTFNGSFSLSGQTVAPQISSLNPPTTTEFAPGAGSAGDFNLLVNGSNFTRASLVRFNGAPLVTTFVSNNTLSVFVPPSLRDDEFGIVVSVTEPSTLASNGVPFPIGDSIPTASAMLTKLHAAGKGAVAQVKGSFSDQATEGHMARIDWGDGASTTLDLGDGSSGTFTASHKYKKAPKQGKIHVTVLDDDLTASAAVEVPLVLKKGHKKPHGHLRAKPRLFAGTGRM
jgi:hypothetical protein